MQGPMQPMAPPPKKGMSTGVIVLIVFAVIFVLVGGTCTAGYFYARHEVRKIDAELKDGSAMVLVSPPEVVAQLAGPKKDYVGSWKSKAGSRLSIKKDGAFMIEKDEDGDGNFEKFNGAIAAFKGDDVELHELITIDFRVAKTPNNDGTRWEMTMDGIRFTRPPTP